MVDHIERSDLREWAHHEHLHLSRLFDDLRVTFNRIALGELEGSEREDALDQAVEDLEVALDDMLEHFNEEEEVYFVAIEQRFPEYSEQISALKAAHEDICTKTQTLQRHLGNQRDKIETMSVALIALVNEVAVAVERHNGAEHEIFDLALARLSEDDRLELMVRKKSLG